MKTVRLLPWVLPLVVLMFCGFGEEKSGLQVTVTKATLSRDDQKLGYNNTDRIDRTQGLKVTVANVSFKPLPEGEVNWEILVRKYDSSVIKSYHGSEKLKPLDKAQSVDMTIGEALVEGYHDGAIMMMDKIEWRIVIKQEGKDVYTASSTPGFDALAKRASGSRKKRDQ